MNWLATFDQESLAAWHSFVTREQLTEQQADQFGRYLAQLVAWSKKTNLTTITQTPTILTDHFQDSLYLGHVLALSGLRVCDIGSGAGFPGLPLAIKYPDMQMTLLEVNQKKVAFLQMVIDDLGLKNCQVYSLDFRTFLRQAPFAIDYFVARASLKPDELVRVFSPSGTYYAATLVYWASRHWQPDSKEKSYIVREEGYTVDEKERRLIFFAGPKQR